MKKKVFSCLLALALVLGCVSQGSLVAKAEIRGAVTAKVSYTAQAAGKFLAAPASKVTVSSDLAESYGFEDAIDAAESVSAIDVLVKIHEDMFGDKFTAETKDEYLSMAAGGYVMKIFGVEDSNNGFTLDGGCPNDGTASEWGGYNGTTVVTTKVANGSKLDFFIYQDDMAKDELAFVEVSGKTVAGQKLTVSVKSVCYAWNGYLYEDGAALKEATAPLKGARLAWVDKKGNIKVIKNVKTNAKGKATITVPNSTKKIYLTALVSANDVSKKGKTPLLMTLTEVKPVKASK